MESPVTFETSVVDGITYETWLQDGHIHRVDGPAYREYSLLDEREVPIAEEWRLNGKYYRADGGPAYRTWVETGVIRRECWYVDGQLHRWGQPAILTWDSQGRVIYQCCYVYGRCVERGVDHRAANTIRRWFLYHRHRREKVISSLLRQDGMIVFPGLMELLRKV